MRLFGKPHVVPESEPSEPAAAEGLGLLLALAVVVCAIRGNDPELVKLWRSEFIGMIVMITLTFSPGKWWGLGEALLGVPQDWLFHAVGVVLADWTCGGPHVNPGVSISMLCLGKLDVHQCAIRIVSQLTAAVVAFTLLQALAKVLGFYLLSGPVVAPTIEGAELITACGGEFAAMLLLCLIVFAANLEPPDRLREHPLFYLTKQSATAIGVRLILWLFPLTGPSINPALATGWVAADTGALPSFSAHYWVYWASSCAGGVVAAALYALYSPRAAFCGATLSRTGKRKVA